MNRNVALLLGAGVGAWAGLFVGSVIAEVILIREEQSMPGHSGYSDEAVEEEESEAVQVLDKKTKMGNKSKNYTKYFENRPELAKLVAKYNGGEDSVLVGDPNEAEPEGEIDASEEDFITSEEQDVFGIKVITVSEFANNEEYDSVTLSYYEDDVVTDEHNNPIVHPEQLLGDDALVSFGEGSDDEDVVYVRNDFKKCMYEVVRAGRPYSMPARKRKFEEEVKNDAEEVDPD